MSDERNLRIHIRFDPAEIRAAFASFRERIEAVLAKEIGRAKSDVRARVLADEAHERSVGFYARAEVERIRAAALGMRCPADGTSCFALDCQRLGCQGGE